MSIPPTGITAPGHSGADLLALHDRAIGAYLEYGASLDRERACCRRRLLAKERTALVAALRLGFALADQRLAAHTWCAGCGRPLGASQVSGQDLDHHLDFCEACATQLASYGGDGSGR